MKNKKTICLALALVLTLGLGASPAKASAAEKVPPYSYQLVCAKDSKGDFLDGTKDGKIVLKLYLTSTINDLMQPLVNAGAFGLRFPKWVSGVSFVSESDFTIQPMVPSDRYPSSGGANEIKQDSYHAFLWSFYTEKTKPSDVWKHDMSLGSCILIGTYTITLPPDVSGGWQLPNKSAVGKLNWLTADEAVPMEYPESQRPRPEDDAFNETVWDAASGQYVGYYQPGNPATAEDAILTRTPIVFRFKAPDAWPDAFTVLSYDPKKEMTIKLYNDEGALVADTFNVPRWTDTTTADTGTLYAGAQADKDTGTGPYFSAIDLSGVSLSTSPTAPVTLTAGSSYKLEISKPSHLTVSLTLKATNTQLSDCEGFPEDDTPAYLPCGDLCSNGGPARIDMADRSYLMHFIGSARPLSEDAKKVDLDGDNRITYADFSIMMAPFNFGKREQ